jgi:hypothetical protein
MIRDDAIQVRGSCVFLLIYHLLLPLTTSDHKSVVAVRLVYIWAQILLCDGLGCRDIDEMIVMTMVYQLWCKAHGASGKTHKAVILSYERRDGGDDDERKYCIKVYWNVGAWGGGCVLPPAARFKWERNKFQSPVLRHPSSSPRLLSIVDADTIIRSRGLGRLRRDLIQNRYIRHQNLCPQTTVNANLPPGVLGQQSVAGFCYQTGALSILLGFSDFARPCLPTKFQILRPSKT